MTHLNLALDYAHQHHNQFLGELKELISIPSISTDPTVKHEVQRAAEWVAGHLRSLGIQNVAIFPTKGHPVVFGELLGAGAEKPTILIYGHYDVQPAEPLDLWQTPAFEPTVIGDQLYGRGSSDMKGQIVATLNAIEAIVRTGSFPANIKFIFEGEEEIGSPNLDEFIASHKDMLASNFALNPDTGMIASDIPTITYGLRGLAYFELRVFGPSGDLHSGLFGGAIQNPAAVLCELIAGMHDAQGRVTLPGFYDSVVPLEEEERKEFTRLPMDDQYYLDQTGVPKLYGETGFTTIERLGGRPTLEVNGLLSGFTGEGSKTVLPAKAMAKISMRLVPDQDPNVVYQQFLAYLKANAPDTVRWEVTKLSGGFPSITDRRIPGVVAFSQALEETWGKRPVFRREGGSVPVTASFQKFLGIESVLVGFGLPEDNIHAPNEKFHLPTYYLGIDALVRFFFKMGA